MVAELVYARDSKSRSARIVGSSPTHGTTIESFQRIGLLLQCVYMRPTIFFLSVAAACFCMNSGIAHAGFRQSDPSTKWPDGLIPYVIDSGLNQDMKTLVLQAMNEWQTKTQSAVRFVERTNQSDYLNVAPATDGRWKTPEPGYHKGVTTFSIGNPMPQFPGNDLTNARHELGHVLGLMHEFVRPDRDSYIKLVAVANEPGWKLAPSGMFVSDGPYDLASVMNYPACSPAGCDKRVNYTSVDGSTLPSVSDISDGDARTIMGWYGGNHASSAQRSAAAQSSVRSRSSSNSYNAPVQPSSVQPPVPDGTNSPGNFSDVAESHPNAVAIRYVREHGLVKGYADGTYKPDSTINRAEFTKIITLAFDPQTTIDLCKDHYFSDVPAGAWFDPYLCQARHKGLINGYPDGSFRPTQQIGFAEAARIIANGFRLVDIPSNCTASACNPQDTPGHPWFEKYVRALEEKHAIPTSVTRFEKSITRGEMAEMLYRLTAGVTDAKSSTYDSIMNGNH